MHVALSVVKWQLVLVYLDDIVAFSRTEAEQIDHVEHELKLYRDAGVSLKLKKSKFLTKTID